MAIINQRNLKQYLGLNYNVLFRGPHGVGKTAIIKKTFEDAGLRWKYFSASTLDPWVDFVGVPRVVQVDQPNAHGGTSKHDVLRLIRPEFIENDEVDAIFFDELNRAPDKVLNAMMELIQFKSINGHKLKNLKVIWAAINPEDDNQTYSVNHLDPAHLDRFHVHINVPFKVDAEYFNAKYPKTGQAFLDWWNDKQMSDEIRAEISPRRLDYAADAYHNNCRLEDFLPAKSGIKKLREMLAGISYHDAILAVKTEDDAMKFLSDINVMTRLLEMAKAGDSVSIDFFVQYGKSLPQELMEPVAEFVFAYKNGKVIYDSMEEMITTLPNTKGNQGTAAIINNADFAQMYANKVGNYEEDLRKVKETAPNLITKLANLCVDVLQTVQATPSGTAEVSPLERLLWGLKGKDENRPTNFNNIVKCLSKLDPSLFSATREKINQRLYSKKIVNEMRFV